MWRPEMKSVVFVYVVCYGDWSKGSYGSYGDSAN